MCLTPRPARSACFAGCHMNTYIFVRLAEDAELRRSMAGLFPRRQPDRRDRWRQRLPCYSCRVSLESERTGRRRSDGMLDFSGCNRPSLREHC